MTDAVLSGAALDTLIALVEKGPLWDGDVPSKSGRNDLLALGYAAKVIVKLEDGWQAATYLGRDVYKRHFNNADTLQEARAMRLSIRSINNAINTKGKP